MKKPKASKRKTPLDQIAAQIHALLKRATKDVIEIGNLLLKSRALLELEHGEWQLWLTENFDLSYRTALRYCTAAEYVYVASKGKSDTVSLFANLSPTVLYALAEGRYSKAVEKAILDAARKGRVDQTRAEEICNKLAPDADPADDEEDGGDDDGAEADPEIEAILDGLPPKVPPAPPFTTQPNIALITFDQAMTSLKIVLTKLPAQFTGTGHSIEDLEKIEAFIRAVIQARRPS